MHNRVYNTANTNSSKVHTDVSEKNTVSYFRVEVRYLNPKRCILRSVRIGIPDYTVSQPRRRNHNLHTTLHQTIRNGQEDFRRLLNVTEPGTKLLAIRTEN